MVSNYCMFTLRRFNALWWHFSLWLIINFKNVSLQFRQSFSCEINPKAMELRQLHEMLSTLNIYTEWIFLCHLFSSYKLILSIQSQNKLTYLNCLQKKRIEPVIFKCINIRNVRKAIQLWFFCIHIKLSFELLHLITCHKRSWPFDHSH